MENNASYDPYARTFARSRERMRWPDLDRLLDLMAETLGAGRFADARVLDAGCGAGRLLDILRERGHAGGYVGIDASEGMIEEAKKRAPGADWRIGDLRALPEIFGDGERFDAAFLVASFHHLPTVQDRLACLRGLGAIVAPGGLVAMTNWHLADPSVAERARATETAPGDFSVPIGAHERYYRAFSRDELASLFRETGWEIVRNEIPDGGRNILSVI